MRLNLKPDPVEHALELAKARGEAYRASNGADSRQNREMLEAVYAARRYYHRLNWLGIVGAVLALIIGIGVGMFLGG